MYHIVHKYLDRQALANKIEPKQMPLINVYTEAHPAILSQQILVTSTGIIA